jgi:ribosomal protein S18 acetylase RimI-like enzyme
MTDHAHLLARYDAQLRGENEAIGAERRFRLGPLWIGVFPGGRGFISYRDLGGLSPRGVRALVAAALAFLTTEPDVREVEWKTRGHDAAEGLHEALVDAGFAPQEPESIMIGGAELLALDLPLPEGVTLRRVTEPEDVRRASYAADRVFEGEPQEDRVADLLERVARGTEVWIAEADGEVVCSGRLEPVPGTDFAGIWGGATHPEWRGRGIYRALTAERARSAVARGVRFINSDSTEYSRPILERSGFVKVSTTTPYEWHRAAVTAG